MAKHWYLFNGPCPPTAAQYAAVSNYAYTTTFGGGIGSFCVGGTCLCAIYATGVGAAGARPNNPLSAHIIAYIDNALTLQSSYPQAPDKAYVYTKP